MTVFWAVTSTLTFIAVALLMYPLLRRGDRSRASRAAFDITVYKDQLAEVESDLGSGLLDATQAEAAKTEIERRMLAAQATDETAPDPSAETQGRSPLTSALLLLLLLAVPLGSFGLYMSIGSPGQEDQPLASRQTEMEQMDSARTDLVNMVRELESRVQADPNNIDAWAYLGQGYLSLDMPGRAVQAFENVVTLTDRHPEALMLLAEAMFEAENGIISIPMKEMFKEAQAGLPNDPRTYHYLSIERSQHDDLAGALAELIKLLEHSPSNAPWIAQVQQRMQSIASELGQSVPAVTMLPPEQFAQPGAPAAGPGPSQQDMQNAADMSADEQAAMIQNMVDQLAARLVENPDDLEGWKRLERAYQVLGDNAKAAEAKAQVERLMGK